MNPTNSSTVSAISTPSLQAAFLCLLPTIQRHAEFASRHLRCSHARADFVAETIAIAWASFVSLARRGKDASEFASILALRCSQRVKAGRRLCQRDSGKDVLAPSTEQRRGISVAHMGQGSTMRDHPWEEALEDNRVSPVPDQAGFRLDFSRWRGSRCTRDREVMDDLMLGERTLEVATKHSLSPGRVSQLRGEWMHDWRRFHGETEFV